VNARISSPQQPPADLIVMNAKTAMGFRINPLPAEASSGSARA